MSNNPLNDTVGAFLPDGLFTINGKPGGPLDGLTFAAKDLFDIGGKPTGAGATLVGRGQTTCNAANGYDSFT